MIKNKFMFVICLLLISTLFAPEGGGDGGGSVNLPTGCGVQKCEMLSLDSVSVMCPEGLKAVVKDSRGMPVEGASVFIGGRFLGLPSRTTDAKGEAVFEKGFVAHQRYTISASKSGKPGYDDLYGYQAAQSKDFVFGEGEFSCESGPSTDGKTGGTDGGGGSDSGGTVNPPAHSEGYCESDNACKENEFCKDNQCTKIKDTYGDSCSRIENHKLIRDACCDSYDIKVTESGKVGDFVPVIVEQCSKVIPAKDLTITDPDGSLATVVTNENGTGIVLKKPGEYSVAYKQAERKIKVKEEEVKEKPLLAFLDDPLIKNVLIVIVVVIILALLYLKMRGKKEEVKPVKEELQPAPSSSQFSTLPTQ
ncbi:carboxypeptidase regulatory-like domain-containing protein [Candidatus Micrarchaeota archaeon]|nr:carboxypeptidase regulatory-like domain-containing protein [Candidatus Micrarchaeota archaeon]